MINVSANGDFQAALNQANPGDTIVLAVGATYTGNFILPYKAGGNDVITITSSNANALPPAGSRVAPSDAVNMPKIVTPNGDAALSADLSAHHYRIIGVEFTTTHGIYCYQIMTFGQRYGNPPDAASQAHDIEVDRCYVHGDLSTGAKGGINLAGASLTVMNSWIGDIASAIQDNVAIGCNAGSGPFWILNNYISSAGENVMFTPTQAGAGIPNNIPSDIVVRGNYIHKPLSWKPDDPSYAGIRYVVKNLLELKGAQRVLVEGNVFENSWIQDQNGYAVGLTTRTENGLAPLSTIRDVTFQNNIFRHVNHGFGMQGRDDNGTGSAANWTIRNNLLDDVAGNLYVYLGGTTGLTIDHNTGIERNWGISLGSDLPRQGFIYTNNIMLEAVLGIFGSSTSGHGAALSAYFPGGYTFTGNIIAGGQASLYPPNNFFPLTVDAVGFIDAAHGNYRLSSSSPYRIAGTDGHDVGVDMDQLLAATATSITGLLPSSPPPGISVSVSPSMISLTNGQSQQFTATVTGSADTRVIWMLNLNSLTPGPRGVLTPDGVYTAPQTINSPQVVNVMTISMADLTKFAEASISLAP